MNQRLVWEFLFQGPKARPIVDVLHEKSGISKAKIKKALQYGACRIQKKDFKVKKRIRKAKALLQKGDHVSFHYDADILSLQPPTPALVHDAVGYSVWDKPAGLLSQGTQFSDHCSMMRQVEIFYKKTRKVFLIHRLDREASGIFIIAHDKKTAAKFSVLFKNRLIQKTYAVEVLGNIEAASQSRKGRISSKLDGKDAETSYTVVEYSPHTNSTKLLVQIKSGRLHQIRRHFDSIGHPVIGDSKYGAGNKNTEGLKLRAISLYFTCPLSQKKVQYQLR